MFEPTLLDAISKKRREMDVAGLLTRHARYRDYLAAFRARFGPERLSGAKGLELLELLHGRGDGSSLVHWLEFKNDDEFPKIFGSIAGGSALKFRIYKSKESGQWMTGTTKSLETIPPQEAVVVAEQHRDQLLAGVSLLEKLPALASQSAYVQLQADMERVAPDLADIGWSHKYFYLVFPELLDDYHSFQFQRFLLLRLLQTPPGKDQRFAAAHAFVHLAHQLDWPMCVLTTVLNALFGPPREYWRIGTRIGDEGSLWDWMHDNDRIGVGWSELGDLNWVDKTGASKERLRNDLAEKYPADPRTIGRQLQQLFNFLTWVQEGDLVVAAEGQRSLGLAQIVGPYTFDPSAPVAHTRQVRWLTAERFELPEPKEGLQTTFMFLSKTSNLLKLERIRLGLGAEAAKRPPPPERVPIWRTESDPAARRIYEGLERKGQVILYGPPGTGKTWQALRACREFAAFDTFGMAFDKLSTPQRNEILGSGEDSGLVRTCSFHPGVGYEDFVEGYRPHVSGGQLGFSLVDGIFKDLCTDASVHPKRRYYLVVDEINRGDVPRILGELITALELDKRDSTLILPLSRQAFSVPRNVFLVGTMNTADRSIALLDTALRRRFAFVELMPDVSLLASGEGSVDVAALVGELNKRICQHVKRDAHNLQVGHAYFMTNGRPVADASKLSRILQDDIIPLVQEYCYEDWEAMASILGSGFIDLDGRTIRTDPFASEDDLLDALRQLDERLIRGQNVGADLEPADDDTSTVAVP